MHVRSLGSAPDIKLRDALVTIPDVLGNGRVEEVGVLADDGDVVAEVGDPDRGGVVGPDVDRPRVGLVETLEKGGDGGFASTRGTDDGNALALGDVDVDALEDGSFRSFWVGELDIPEGDRTRRKLGAEDTLRFVGVGGTFQ